MDPPKNHRYVVLLAAAVLILFWILSVADPCLIAILSRAPSPSSNPIAITECYVNEAGIVVITRGDVIIRLAALALVMGLFGIVCALIEPGRRKRSFGVIGAAGASCAFAVYIGGQAVLFANPGLAVVHLKTWVVCMIVASLAVMTGAAIAKTTEHSEI